MSPACATASVSSWVGEAMLLGVSLRPQYSDWESMREAAVTADELGFDWLLTSDHLIASENHRPDPDGSTFEAWQLVAASGGTRSASG